MKNEPIEDEGKVYIIAELGINHNGDLNIAKKLIFLTKSGLSYRKKNCNIIPYHDD